MRRGKLRRPSAACIARARAAIQQQTEQYLQMRQPIRALIEQLGARVASYGASSVRDRLTMSADAMCAAKLRGRIQQYLQFVDQALEDTPAFVRSLDGTM